MEKETAKVVYLFHPESESYYTMTPEEFRKAIEGGDREVCTSNQIDEETYLKATAGKALESTPEPVNDQPTKSPETQLAEVLASSAVPDEEKMSHILKLAEQTVNERIRPALNLIADVKKALNLGTDKIAIEQLNEWSVVIPIICQELTPMREAFSLSKTLWDIETKKVAATNLLELRQKKTEIEQINRLAGTKGDTEKAVKEYLRSVISSTQDSLTQLSYALRRILDYRMNREGGQ